MTQRDLNRAVARATGETVDRVGRLGFQIIVVPGPVPAWCRRRSRRSRRQRPASGPDGTKGPKEQVPHPGGVMAFVVTPPAFSTPTSRPKGKLPMIEIPRSLARHLSAVVRSSIRKPYYPHPPVVDFHADAEGLRVRVVQGEVAVEYRQPGLLIPATATLPLDALATIEGRDDCPVILEARRRRRDIGPLGGRRRAPGHDLRVARRRQAAGVPRAARAVRPQPGDAVERPWPKPARSAADEETRYAMHRIQLRGKTGDVVATDSKELYIHAGFNFGWTDDVLVSRVGAFGRPELGPVEAVEVGKTDKHVVFGVGPWTIYLGIDEAGRYPDVDLVCPSRAPPRSNVGSRRTTRRSCCGPCRDCPARPISTSR